MSLADSESNYDKTHENPTSSKSDEENDIKEEPYYISETEDEIMKANIQKNMIRRQKGQRIIKTGRLRAVTIDLDNDNLDDKIDLDYDNVFDENMQDADNVNN
jgi:hypothetical protein